MMADVTLKYKGATIGELSESGNATLETAGKYCEADILLEYVKSGGASYEMKLLYETAPTTEQVSAIKVDFTSSMLGYDFYRIVLLGSFARQPYPYVGINTETNTTYLNGISGTTPGTYHYECYVAKLGTSYVAYLGSRANLVNGDLSYFHTRSYAADGYFNTGFVVQIWGCNYENS